MARNGDKGVKALLAEALGGDTARASAAVELLHQAQANYLYANGTGKYPVSDEVQEEVVTAMKRLTNHPDQNIAETAVEIVSGANEPKG